MHINNFQCGADYSLPLHLYGQEKIERDYVGSIFLSSDINTQRVIIQNWHEMQRRGGEKTERGTVETSKTDGNVLCGPHVQPAVIPCKALLPSLTCHTFACAVPPVGWRLRDIRPSYAHARGEDGKRVRGIQRVHSVRLSKRKKIVLLFLVMEHFTTLIHTDCVWPVCLEGTIYYIGYTHWKKVVTKTGGLRMEDRQGAERGSAETSTGKGNQSIGREL